MKPARYLPLLPLMLLISACEKEEEAAAPLRPVLSMIVEPRTIAPARFAGTVMPHVQTQLGFRVIGRLVARDVDLGDRVQKGQSLAALDPTAFELAVRSAQADLASAEATLANASAAEERMRALQQLNTASPAVVESAELSREAAQASLVRATAALAKAEEQRSYTQIIADYDGVVTSTGAEVGQVVSAGQTIVTVARPDERDAVVDVPETVPGLEIGTGFTVSLQINPDITVAGAIREIAPAADEATRTRRVKIALDTPPEAFRLGTTVTATIDTATPQALVIPQSSVLSSDGRTFVWVIDEAGGVARTEVRLVSATGQPLVVAEGLKPGDRIATAGVNTLQDGQKIRLEDRVRP